MKPWVILIIAFSCGVLVRSGASWGQPTATAPHDLSVSGRGTWTKWADAANGLPAGGTVTVGFDLDHDVIHALTKPKPDDPAAAAVLYSAKFSDPKPAFKPVPRIGPVPVPATNPADRKTAYIERRRELWPQFVGETCVRYCVDSQGRFVESSPVDRYGDNHVYASPLPPQLGTGNWTAISNVADFAACSPPIRPDDKYIGGPPWYATNAPMNQSALGWIMMALHPTPWGELFLGSELGGFFHSFDDGKTWSNIDDNFYHPQRDASGCPAYVNPGYPDPAAALHGGFGNCYPTVLLTKNNEVLMLDGYNTILYTSDGRTTFAEIPLFNAEVRTRHAKIYNSYDPPDLRGTALRSGAKTPANEILEWDDTIFNTEKPARMPFTQLTSKGQPFTPSQHPVTDGTDIYVGSTTGAIWKWTSADPLWPVVKMDANKTVACPGPVAVSGGVAQGQWKYEWRARGPAEVTFFNPLSPSTQVVFAAPGDYVLSLRAVEGAVSTGNSMVMHVTAKEGGDAPAIATQPPPSQVLSPGKAASITTAAAGAGPLRYQWYSDGFKIVGAHQATYTLASPSLADSGATFYCVVTSPYGRAACNCCTLGLPPQIVGDPPSLTVAAAKDVTLAVAAAGTEPLTWQWRKNGQNIPKANKPSLRIKNAQASDAAAYSVVVSNILGSATSKEATLAIGDGGPELHKLTIKSQCGTATEGGWYPAGAVVPIFTGPHRSGAGTEKFTGWKAQPASAPVGDRSANATTLTMPAQDVTLTASDSGDPPGFSLHRLTVVNGVGAGSFATDAQVTVAATDPPPAMAFDHWAGGPVGVDGAAKPTFTFSMPASNITVWATYKPAAAP